MCTKSENLNSYDGSVKCHLGVPMFPEILGTLLMERILLSTSMLYFKLTIYFAPKNPLPCERQQSNHGTLGLNGKVHR